MSFTDNNDLEIQASGGGDWDTGIGSNHTILDRGFHIKLSAGDTINTGDILWVQSGAVALPWVATSVDLTRPVAMSYKSVASGDTATFLATGAIASIGIWSGNIIPGEPVFVSANTAGFLVSSYSAAWPPVGIALRNEQVHFHPGRFEHTPEKNTLVTSLGPIQVGSTHFFNIDIGHRGMVTRIDYVAESHDLFQLKFFSGSAQVSSEQLFDSGAISSMTYVTRSPFPYENTDVASPGLLFGTLDVTSSATGVASGDFSLTVISERFR